MFTQSFYNNIAVYDNGKKGKAILFLHGVGASATFGEFLTKSYPDNRILLLDLPGHGASKWKGEEIDIYKIAVELNGLLEHYGLVKPILCGHSLGGQIALLFDIIHPYVVESLILISPAGLENFNSLQKQTILSSLQFGNYMQQLFVPRITGSIPMGDYSFPDQKVISAYIKSMIERPVHELLGRITCKCSVVFGENDLFIPNRLFSLDGPVAFAKKVLGPYPDFTVLPLANSGHWPMAENVQGLVKLLKEQVSV